MSDNKDRMIAYSYNLSSITEDMLETFVEGYTSWEGWSMVRKDGTLNLLNRDGSCAICLFTNDNKFIVLVAQSISNY